MDNGGNNSTSEEQRGYNLTSEVADKWIKKSPATVYSHTFIGIIRVAAFLIPVTYFTHCD